MLDGLGADALVDSENGAVLRVSLPWIRSLPIAAARDVEVQIDGAPVSAPQVRLGDRRVALQDLVLESGWWFVQDRLALELDRRLDAGSHLVRLRFGLAIPYLQVGPDGPLTLPFHFERELTAVAPGSPAGVALDVA
ncbi:hypothetical protein [Microbacterium sp. W4I20]|uniref:hypothetical protein n=1 Tax=Microbacterium sp. W4I20 TaxID=3042262 RepID=UPI00277EA5AA|nr:hypothetical protein [Microbacterium sp. W4I20]MDQ0726562.1 hypothetical protein [Microbacterium sp. W4I20]